MRLLGRYRAPRGDGGAGRQPSGPEGTRACREGDGRAGVSASFPGSGVFSGKETRGHALLPGNPGHPPPGCVSARGPREQLTGALGQFQTTWRPLERLVSVSQAGARSRAAWALPDSASQAVSPPPLLSGRDPESLLRTETCVSVAWWGGRWGGRCLAFQTLAPGGVPLLTGQLSRPRAEPSSEIRPRRSCLSLGAVRSRVRGREAPDTPGGQE